MSQRQPAGPANRRVLLYLFGALALIAFALIWLTAGGRSGEVNDRRSTYDRDEFRRLVMGERKERVLKIIGRPDQSQESPDH